MEIEYFMSSLASDVMGILTENFLWMRTLGSTPILENEVNITAINNLEICATPSIPVIHNSVLPRRHRRTNHSSRTSPAWWETHSGTPFLLGCIMHWFCTVLLLYHCNSVAVLL